MPNKLYVSLFALLTLFFTGNVRSELPNNVSYSAVTELDFQAPDATLQYGEDGLQIALLWRAKGEPAEALVVFVHGGCWLNSYDIAHSRAMTTALAQSGYDVLSIEYRRTGDEGGGWPGSLQDIRSALTQFLHDQPVAPSAQGVILTGHSAGGHLALLAAADDAPYMDKITTVVGLAAITDLPAYAQGTNGCQRATVDFMQGDPQQKADEYQAADPRQAKISAPIILLHGGKDGIVPEAQGSWPGIPTQWVDEAGHFDWLHPDTSAFSTLLNTLNSISAGGHVNQK
ncbi:alpha/beta hydrolase family protein [Aestuariibacter salexigens]|uniref:alpha/beta hydrolase family protein n=1 Tax=Aestuariibacter salexigens TaxID=226010 RepID=UPI0003FC2278|nr:alpha/beta hydrolase [Aestuariibacter salexigens]